MKKCYDIKEYADILLETIEDKRVINYYQSNIEKSIEKYDIDNVIKKWIEVIEE